MEVELDELATHALHLATTTTTPGVTKPTEQSVLLFSVLVFPQE